MAVNSLKPTWGNVLVLMDEPEESIGLIIVPEESREKKLTGLVVAVGPGKVDLKGRRHESDYKPGDRVLLGMHFGYKVTWRNVEMKMVEERFIQCALKKEMVIKLEPKRWEKDGYEYEEVQVSMVSSSLAALVSAAGTAKVIHKELKLDQGWEVGQVEQSEDFTFVKSIRRLLVKQDIASVL